MSGRRAPADVPGPGLPRIGEIKTAPARAPYHAPTRALLLLLLLAPGCRNKDDSAADTGTDTTPPVVDDDDPDLADAATWALDFDGDGYGGGAITVAACTAPRGYTVDTTDCDDADAGTHPGATETCDDADQDCDGGVDEGATDGSTWYDDSDADGYGAPGTGAVACEQPSGTAENAGDCDDADASSNPGATEACDGTDHDCDGDPGLSTCTSCATLLAADSSLASGLHTIDLDGDGGTDPFDVVCDMDTDGGGWTQWWWKDTTDTMGGVSDVLGESSLWDCDPSADSRCFATLPASAPGELLVTNQTGNWAVWEFDGTDTATRALNAFTTQTASALSSASCGDTWNPVAQDLGFADDPYTCDVTDNHGGTCRCFWYAEASGVTSFYLDDDTGYYETAFGAGYDTAGGFGVDSLETSYRLHDTASGLWLYWR